MPFLVSMGRENQLQSILCVDNCRKTVEAFFINKHDLDKDMDYIKRELGVVFNHLSWILPFLYRIQRLQLN